MTDVSMQRILLDTNVLLDYLLHRDDHAKMAEAVMELGAKNNITLLCASLSLKDIAYLSSSAIRREFKPNESEVENFTRGFLSSRVPWRCIEQVKDTCRLLSGLRIHTGRNIRSISLLYSKTVKSLSLRIG